MLPYVIKYPKYLYIMLLKLIDSVLLVINVLGFLCQNNKNWEAIHGEGYTKEGFIKIRLYT